jgi:hypothetical protein
VLRTPVCQVPSSGEHPPPFPGSPKNPQWPLVLNSASTDSPSPTYIPTLLAALPPSLPGSREKAFLAKQYRRSACRYSLPLRPWAKLFFFPPSSSSLTFGSEFLPIWSPRNRASQPIFTACRSRPFSVLSRRPSGRHAYYEGLHKSRLTATAGLAVNDCPPRHDEKPGT